MGFFLTEEKVQKLVDEFNSPLYVFDKNGFIKNYFALFNSMRAIYPNYQIAYSYKTNYTPYICKLVKDMGGYAEVVSDMEYCLAKKIGYSEDKIIYNGPAKGTKMFENMIGGGMVNIDNLQEAYKIAEFAKENKVQISVGIRVNIDFDDGFISRFGVEVGSDDFNSIVSTLSDAGVEINGLHFHLSRHRELSTWAKRTNLLIKIADQFLRKNLKYISLGSGMYADMETELKEQFHSVPSYEEYAQVTMQPFFEHYGKDGPIVFTEPGTTLVARYISFISKVLSIKKIKDKTFACMDGSFENLGEICTIKNIPVKKVLSGHGERAVNVDLVGYTCLEQDVMRKNYDQPIAIGDVLVFGNVGGYSIVSKPPFIQPNCSMVEVCGDDFKKIMRGETFDDVFSKFSYIEEDGEKL